MTECGGTTFKRPGLDAMLEEIRAGNVATVIIKDQSRIGRDVVEVGLLKRTFDEYHVRFIAANDNLDTANGFDIMSIFRDVINEWYVADTSGKSRPFSSREWKRACAAPAASAMATLRPRENKGEWVIDEESRRRCAPYLPQRCCRGEYRQHSKGTPRREKSLSRPSIGSG